MDLRGSEQTEFDREVIMSNYRYQVWWGAELREQADFDRWCSQRLRWSSQRLMEHTASIIQNHSGIRNFINH